MVFSVGFLSVGSIKAYAYTGEYENTYPIKWNDDIEILIRANDWSTLIYGEQGIVFDANNNSYKANNAKLTDVKYITWAQTWYGMNNEFIPTLYDYYYLITVQGDASSATEFNFVPDRILFREWDCTNGYGGHYADILKTYHHDVYSSIGFTIFGKVPIDEFDNTNLMYIEMQDSRGSRTIGSDLTFQGLIIAMPKDSSEGSLGAVIAKLDAINNSVNNQGSAISSVVTQAKEEIQKTLEEQYEMSEEEDFGVEDIVDQVKSRNFTITFF